MWHGETVFGEEHREPPAPGLVEFEQAMSEAASTGADAWIVTKAGEVFAGEVQKVSVSVENSELFGREVTVRINSRELLFQEVANWTVGLTGEPTDDQLDAAITQALDLIGPMSVEDLVVRLSRPPMPAWCTVPRALGRLQVLEAERWVQRIEEDGQDRWRFSRRRTERGWEME
jgi:hypothetical protein